MSLHLEAKPGQIAETVLLPGDPLRAKFIAENFLEDIICYNELRGMLGFTGSYKGKRVSVQGTGIGMPSTGLYVRELIDYGAQNLIRVGTCGALQLNISLGEVIFAMSACTDSGMNQLSFDGQLYSPTATFGLLEKAVAVSRAGNISPRIGSVLSTDTFYKQDNWYEPWTNHGVLAAEMETAIIYTLAARYNREAFSILTVSDNILTGDMIDPKARENSFTDMMQIALEIA